ncbi:hypothetical protein COOONC_10833, partial [Cooperia oncophora]
MSYELLIYVFQVFSTATAFYIPLIAIIVIYWKILRAAKKRFKRERDRRTVIRPPPDKPDCNEKLAPLILKKNKKITVPQNSVANGEKSEEYKNKKSIGESSTSTQSEEERTISHTQPEQETKLDDQAIH